MKRIMPFVMAAAALAQTPPTITVPGFEVRTVATGFTTPTGIAFLGTNDLLVLEKNSGRVLRWQGGLVSTVLDLSVNFASERGLLGIALHPSFPSDPGVYLFWTCRSSAPGTVEGGPTEEVCDESRMTGVEDTNNVLSVPLRGNRVDRFRWTGTGLTFERNIIALRSFQADGASTPPNQGDAGQSPLGNHNGGVITFGADGKLYIFYGDQGRRGQMQNLAEGPTPPTPDDQFGGPEPDDNHLSGVILRLNPDGTAPDDNPFVGAAAGLPPAVAANVRKVFAYGLRNGFGMTVDPFSGRLWITEHGDDTFDEINMVRPGMNGGWIQISGPLSRLSEYRGIETTFGASPGLQQLRWPPTNIATSALQARARLYMLPGATYSDPQFSWRYVTWPGAMSFAPRSFGRGLAGDLLVSLTGNPGAGVGYLLQFPMHVGRRAFEFTAPELADRVADNNAKYDLTETQSLIIGSGFGIVTDMRISPANSVYVLSYSKGSLYEIVRTAARLEDDDDPDIAGVGDVLSATVESQGSGSPVGGVEIRLHSGRELFCFDSTLANVNTSGSIALRHQAGGTDRVVLELPVTERGQGSGCIEASAGLIREIRANPGAFYLSLDGRDAANSSLAVAPLR
jgi:aldose sugar dehydrogenase